MRILISFVVIFNFLFAGVNEDLFIGIEKKDIKAVELAIKMGANVNIKNKDGNSALIEASQKDLVEIVAVLIKNNANLEAEGQFEQTAMEEAISVNALNVIKLLIDNGAKINENYIMNAKSKDAIKLLLNGGAKIGGLNKQEEEIILTILNDDKFHLETLLKQGHNLEFEDIDGKTPLMYASISNSLDIVYLLLKDGAKINEEDKYGMTAMIFAVENNLIDMANLLIKNGADVNNKDIRGWTPLMVVNSKEMVELLVKNGAEIEFDNNSALMIASLRNMKAVAKALIENGADVNFRSDSGDTPLMKAVSGNANEILEMLINNGADINATNNLNRTALIEAVEKNSIESIKILIKNKANLDYVPNGIIWGSALTEASKINAKEIVQLLIDGGADIEVRDYFEMTPLMTAVKSNSQDVIKLLLKNGANIYAKSLGKKPIDFARVENRKEIEKLFTSKLLEGLNNNIKYAEEAVTIWNKELKRRDEEYTQAIGLFLDYQNNTMKRIVGISLQVEVVNPFNKIVYKDTIDEEILLEPREKMVNETFWKFKDNEFISDQPYDLMWKMADNGTAKINTKILKVIFDDGTIMLPKPQSTKNSLNKK